MERIVFTAKTILKDNSRATVRGSGCHQKEDGSTYIFGVNCKGEYKEVKIIVETLKIERSWK